MKKRMFFSAIFLLFCLIVLTGCDPVFPQGTISIVPLETLSQGTTVDIEIIYPPPPGSIVFSWKEQNIEILKGIDIVTVSGLSITGLKPGIALIKVNATAYCSPGRQQESIYSTEIEIKVK